MDRDTRTEAIETRIREAVARLMTTQGESDRIRVSVPVLYPSGATSTIEISSVGDTCFVSDMGAGHTEAYLANAAEFYNHQAKRAADRFGVGYDGQSMFLLRAPMDQIEGAIATVANASVQAASFAILKADEDKDRRRNDEVYDRVRSIFGVAAVAKEAVIEGLRSTWDAHNVVALPHGRRAVFEFVTANANSISNRFMMFSDVSMRKEPISLNAVVKDAQALGPKGGLLADVSNVISLAAANDDFLRYARVA